MGGLRITIRLRSSSMRSSAAKLSLFSDSVRFVSSSICSCVRPYMFRVLQKTLQKSGVHALVLALLVQKLLLAFLPLVVRRVWLWCRHLSAHVLDKNGSTSTAR